MSILLSFMNGRGLMTDSFFCIKYDKNKRFPHYL